MLKSHELKLKLGCDSILLGAGLVIVFLGNFFFLFVMAIYWFMLWKHLKEYHELKHGKDTLSYLWEPPIGKGMLY